MERPPTPEHPDEPYTFGDFVHVVEKDIYYGRALHKIVKYGRENPDDADWALTELAYHVVMPEFELDELGTDDSIVSDRCSNTTKFFMLDFCRYV